jgi:hypothetical protein
VTKRIPLTRGLFAFVDDDDFEKVVESRVRWHAYPGANGKTWRVSGKPFGNDGPERSLGQFILGVAPPLEVTYRDYNGLNCTRANLMVGTHSQVMARLRPVVPNKWGYRGVLSHSNGKGFRAQLGCRNRRLKSKDIYATAEEAAREYDRMAQKQFGDFAILNFPDDAPKSQEDV